MHIFILFCEPLAYVLYDITVATMYVDTSTINQKGKSYTRHLLRESYREEGKVKHRTIANLSRCTPAEIEAIRLALWQVIARVIDQGSSLSAVRLAGSHAACDVLHLDKFNEDDLYENLDWLCENQGKIEGRLFQERHGKKKPGLYLYDVTSCYLEGEQNALASFGLNRDGKKGKKILVVGLLCDGDGIPLSVEVFTGNTSDIKTFASQVRKVAERFGGGEVTFVRDRGMIKNRQIVGILKKGSYRGDYLMASLQRCMETKVFDIF